MPYSQIPYNCLQKFFVSIHSLSSLDYVIEKVFGTDKMYINFDDLMEIYKMLPGEFHSYKELRKEFRNLLGYEFCKRIDYRRNNIEEIMAYNVQHHKFPRESCGDSITRFIHSLAPKTQFDYSVPLDKVDNLLNHLIRFYCSLYYPSCSLIREKMSSIESSGLIGLSKREVDKTASDCSKPRSKRSTFTISSEQITS